MAKDQTKSGSGATRAGVLSKRGLARDDRTLRERFLERLFEKPTVGWNTLIWGVFILICGSLATWARNQPLVATGQVMNDTTLARVPFELEDREQTAQKKMLVRQQTPRVLDQLASESEAIRASIELLPKSLASTNDFADVAPELKQQFKLTEEAFAAIRAEAPGGELSPSWAKKAERLAEFIQRRPLLDAQTYQRTMQEGVSREIELKMGPVTGTVFRDDLVSIDDARQLTDAMTQVAQKAGFTEPALTTVVTRLTTNPKPTYSFDEAASVERQNARVKAVPTAKTLIPVGQVIYRRGDVLQPQQFDQYRREIQEFTRQPDSYYKVLLRTMSVFGAVTAIALAVAGYLFLFCPRVHTSPGRTAGVAALLAGALVLSTVGTVLSPGLLTVTALAPTVFVAVILVIAYDQRVALALGTLQGVLTCIALDQPIGVYALSLTGVSFAVLELKEIRDRRGIIRMGLYAAAALSVGTVMVALIDRPIVWEALRQTFADAALAGLGGLGVGVLTLALLPTIEKAFDVTTGLTLIELRDHKQPLLRQLQQRAPGTYNHSLNVASIAEAAADAIKADSLLTYVGALYHDIGKMNKPEYFVENQAGGPNKHDKLSPAMSLLVIVGHVKDGMAMAEEHNLPESIRHFIEAHHGTTLVEFFYNRARRQAELNAKSAGATATVDPELPEEIEYRYPGPKPRTKECAILMLADAVESATRTMTEPTPSRIEALVRALANKRLMDGQFDECELTLRDLQTICDSISKTVASIYHGRVLYPSTSEMLKEKEEKRA